MKYSIQTPEDLGLLLRAVRKHSQVRQDDLAAMVGVSKQFASDVENGKPTAQFGRVLKLLREAGILLDADIPDAAAAEVARLQAKNAARKPKAAKTPAKTDTKTDTKTKKAHA